MKWTAWESVSSTGASTAKIVTRTDLLDHLFVGTTEDYALVDRLIDAAQNRVRDDSRRALLTARYRAYYSGWGTFDVPLPPLQSLVSVEYLTQGASTWTAYSSTNLSVESWREPARIVLKANRTFPSATLETGDAVRVTFDAGSTSAAAVPDRTKHALRMLVGHLYEHREDPIDGSVSQMPDGYWAMLGDRAYQVP